MEMIQSQNGLLWQIWVVLSCLSNIGSYLRSSRRKCHSHPNFSLIEVIEANLSNHHCSTGTVFSPQILIFAHGMIRKLDGESIAVLRNLNVCKFVNHFCTYDKSITYNAHTCPVTVRIGRILCPVYFFLLPPLNV